MKSDEEKKAIEWLKKADWFSARLYAPTILYLIEKQSKEIEELKDKNKKLQDKAKELIFEKQELTSALLDSTPNDKIKAKIEEFKIVRDTILENEKEFNRPMMTYDLKRNDYCEKMLQSLLEKEQIYGY